SACRGRHDKRNRKGQAGAPEISLKTGAEQIAGAGRAERAKRVCVCARRLEDDEREVEDPGHAELKVEAERRDDVHTEVDEEQGHVVLLGVRQATPSRCATTSARIPWGRKSRNSTRITKALTSR